DGNRSIGRRLGMGEAAGTLADLAIVTSGHNRFETFEQILHDTEIGLRKAPHPQYIAIKDRAEAIRYALENAREGDLITIIGLGHEHWQEEMGVKRHWNDEEFVLKTLGEMGLL
ncbi:MAG: UDP-N-acetylmuramoyl-L-alanyl-D-glutamate--2,6-diaminopimelate ligase, partial [Lachnospiraceae bacterium]|nr:UDP-N-acetylmuramoyl-L-alanyl-D-glutamate--2,6-diaminopimelate ligase [Lachnospiraceae bacterium]